MKETILKHQQYIKDGDWDGFFDAVRGEQFDDATDVEIFQFCLECVPDLLYKITYIPNNAFYHSDIKSITIPSNIKEIGFAAFAGCENLKSVIIQNGVKAIDQWAFVECVNLTNIAIPDSVVDIDYTAFEDCINLKRISIPKHLEYEDFLPEDCKIKVRQ